MTVLHALFALAAGRRGRRWTATSWMLALSHLGMLDTGRSLGIPNAITVLRANLPAIGRPAHWLPGVALASDLADGRIARCTGMETVSGRHADSLADAAFWTWFALRHEPSRGLRIAALAAWTAPVVIVAAASAACGRMVEAPQPTVLRPAAAMQAILAARAVLRSAAADQEARVPLADGKTAGPPLDALVYRDAPGCPRGSQQQRHFGLG